MQGLLHGPPSLSNGILAVVLCFFDIYICSLIIKLFYSFFKTLVGKEVTVELKNDMSIRGRLESVDQFLNLKLADISVTDEERYPHMVLPFS